MDYVTCGQLDKCPESAKPNSMPILIQHRVSVSVQEIATDCRIKKDWPFIKSLIIDSTYRSVGLIWKRTSDARSKEIDGDDWQKCTDFFATSLTSRNRQHL